MKSTPPNCCTSALSGYCPLIFQNQKYSYSVFNRLPQKGHQLYQRRRLISYMSDFKQLLAGMNQTEMGTMYSPGPLLADTEILNIVWKAALDHIRSYVWSEMDSDLPFFWFVFSYKENNLFKLQYWEKLYRAYCFSSSVILYWYIQHFLHWVLC